MLRLHSESQVPNDFKVVRELLSQYYFTHSLRCIMICIIVWALAYGTVSCQFQFSFS